MIQLRMVLQAVPTSRVSETTSTRKLLASNVSLIMRPTWSSSSTTGYAPRWREVQTVGVNAPLGFADHRLSVEKGGRGSDGGRFAVREFAANAKVHRDSLLQGTVYPVRAEAFSYRRASPTRMGPPVGCGMASLRSGSRAAGPATGR